MFGIKPLYRVGIRDRTLTDAELRLVWLAAGDLGGSFGPITRLLILTGQRRGEVGDCPGWRSTRTPTNGCCQARSKNKLPNLIPLTDAARAIIDDVPVIEGKAQFLFTRSGACPATNFAQAKAKLDASMMEQMRSEAAQAGASVKEVAALALSPWTFHDLRRTFATGCQRLGFPTEVTEAVINQVGGSRGGIVGVYQTYRFQAEKRAALEAWSRHVEDIVRGSTGNVVAIKAARA
jgi:integrase